MKNILKRTASVAVAGALLLQFSSTVFAGTRVVIRNNGAHSRNRVRIQSTQDVDVTQTNRANITNTVVAVANTGDNLANGNTGGNTSITTGDASASATIVNVANANIAVVNTCCNGDTPCEPVVE
ncbi:MAG: hypothetical protein A2900_02855 [Candidatus Chisholmbacteria bacterium RIFCSPLOWO2_01_FULL_50_28]|uniref:DUF5666 domain-containing protein n=1 Tax=Candidatus Chisholmbacteria bacterium RIFCSPHIGHO2_01_FULL_52_32 TaxID=1797591 RepID=A0A1G1VT96_9BACT|nr:MAG: hypothetical protein A2786_03890 [Candidatus Chisholmbacteria bacterium RIFCSPHIGHO2_01_FULL_52_32]OGY20017.1 MAG: hypothetical protein A2900_02855 [Candidatus Chisholmbacteria bacterium RIFCSPLOWO2_01_FULL_50_28]